MSFNIFITNTMSNQKIYKSLLQHERDLLDRNELCNITHSKSTSAWLISKLSIVSDEFVNAYRPMGDIEILYLLEHNQLPTTQPYQAIIEGINGFYYSNKYLVGHKKVDTSPTTIVEFTMPKYFLEELKQIQSKIEDGAISVGLGDKAGGGITRFNEFIKDSKITFKIVKVKRSIKSKN